MASTLSDLCSHALQLLNPIDARIAPHGTPLRRSSLRPSLPSIHSVFMNETGHAPRKTTGLHSRQRLSAWTWSIWLRATQDGIVSAAAVGRGKGGFPGDDLGMYPWDPSWHAADNDSIEWMQEDIITFFTTDGLIQIGGLRVPRQILLNEKQARERASNRYRRYREEDYMDPKQGLCLGAIFDIAATNGLDMGRRFCVFGFCRSVEMLSDVVEDTVLEQGGEVVAAEKGSNGGLNEKLSMTVAMPLLWGVPPAVDTLNHAIRSGGGIVEKVCWKWEF